MTFENCTFTNLGGNTTGDSYLFSSWQDYPSLPGGGGTVAGYGGNLTLRNCTFNFDTGSAGLCAFATGNYEDGDTFTHYLLIDGVKINDNGGQRPLVWLYGTLNSPFKFRLNSVNSYIRNGTTLNLNDPATTTSLESSGVIRLTNGATLVPAP